MSGVVTARGAGLLACHRCGRVMAAGTQMCPRCHGPVTSREPNALQQVWAWWFAGLIAYIPANIYPMLLTRTLVEKPKASTIVGGVVDLVHHHAYGIAAIVFVASVVIPIAKFAAIAYLALSVQRRSMLNRHERHLLYEVVEFIGRWSMIDVFVVAILAALVQLDAVATINPGVAAVAFALSVAFTMLSAQSFDPRAIWDAEEDGA